MNNVQHCTTHYGVFMGGGCSSFLPDFRGENWLKPAFPYVHCV